MVRFISLSSGSNGNCYYIGNEISGFIIDSGIGPRTIKKRLLLHDIAIESIKFVLVTHEHIDHIKSLGTIAERLHIPVYATAKLHKIMESHFCTRGRLKGCVEKTTPYLPTKISDVTVVPFPVPHDAKDTVGYFIDIEGVKFTFITDVGDITDDIIKYASLSNILIMESNYDLDMLLKGSYSPDLKLRITTGAGHLSNEKAAYIIKQVYHRDLHSIFLCHLSENNNTPELAYNAIEKALCEIGVKVGSDVTLSCLPRKEPSAMFTF